jgi:hypothetical protein
MLAKALMSATSSIVPKVISTSSATNLTSGTSLSISAPSGIQNGDLLIAFLVSGATASGGSWNTASGWSNSGSGRGLSIQSKTATSSEPASYSFSTSTTIAVRRGIIVCIRNGTIGIVGSNRDTASGTTNVVADSISVPSSASLLFALYYMASGQIGATTNPSTPSGFTITDSLDVDGQRPSLRIFQRSYVSSGSSGNVTSSWNLSTTRSALQMSISPA